MAHPVLFAFLTTECIGSKVTKTSAFAFTLTRDVTCVNECADVHTT